MKYEGNHRWLVVPRYAAHGFGQRVRQYPPHLTMEQAARRHLGFVADEDYPHSLRVVDQWGKEEARDFEVEVVTTTTRTLRLK